MLRLPGHKKKYEGEYELGGVTAKFFTKNEMLYLFVPGQPEYELTPVERDKFATKALPGYYVQFAASEKGDMAEVTFMQPNGNFKAKKKQIH